MHIILTPTPTGFGGSYVIELSGKSSSLTVISGEASYSSSTLPHYSTSWVSSGAIKNIAEPKIDNVVKITKKITQQLIQSFECIYSSNSYLSYSNLITGPIPPAVLYA